MLNRDQYNQDEYNDYYARATEGAEIKHGRKESGNGKKILFVIFLFLAIGALAYFIMQTLKESNDQPEAFKKAEAPKEQTETSKEVAMQTQTTTQTTPTKTPSSQEEVTKQVTQAVGAEIATKGQTMNPEEIAKIVQAVIASMNNNNQASGGIQAPTTAQDAQLIAELSDEEESLLSSPDIMMSNISESDSKKEASSGETIDTYNKVVVNDTVPTNDELSQIATALSDIVEEESSVSSNYTQSITKEVSARKKEMRIWVVKKGDTLGGIAKKVYGNVMDYKKIYQANPDILRRPDRIYIGQKLRIPE